MRNCSLLEHRGWIRKSIITAAGFVMMATAFSIASPPAGEQLLDSVARFRDQSRTAPEAAFVQYTGKNAQKLFGSLGRLLCPSTDPSNGWSYFFETSATSLVFLNDKTALSLHYHPYSDTALIVEWKQDKKELSITDAELLMGDTLRRKGRPPYDIEPHWLRRSIPPYLAASLSAAETVKTFHRIFETNEKPYKGKWRAAVLDAKLLSSNHLGVGYMFEQNLRQLAEYRNASHLKAIMHQTEGALSLLGQGHVDQLLAIASETRPESRQPLEQFSADWALAKVVTYVVRPEQSATHHFVLFSLPERPEYLMSFYYAQYPQDPDTLTLKRIDLIDHNEVFKNYETINDALKSF